MGHCAVILFQADESGEPLDLTDAGDGGNVSWKLKTVYRSC